MSEPASVSIPGPVSLSFRTSNAPSGAHSGALAIGQRSEGMLPPSTRSTSSMTPHTGAVHPPNKPARWGILAIAAVVALGGAAAAGRVVSSPQPQAASANVSAIPDEVSLEVDAPGGKMVFRGREFVLPYTAEVRSSAERERIEVHAADGSTRTVWVTLSQAQQVWIARSPKEP